MHCRAKCAAVLKGYGGILPQSFRIIINDLHQERWQVAEEAGAAS